MEEISSSPPIKLHFTAVDSIGHGVEAELMDKDKSKTLAKEDSMATLVDMSSETTLGSVDDDDTKGPELDPEQLFSPESAATSSYKAPHSRLYREHTIFGDASHSFDVFARAIGSEASVSGMPAMPLSTRTVDMDTTKEVEFKRIWIQSDTLGPHREAEDVRLVCKNLQLACLMRDKWVYKSPSGDMPLAKVKSEDMLLNVDKAKRRGVIPPADDRYSLEMREGVFVVRCKGVASDRRASESRKGKDTPFQPFSYNEFVHDLNFVMKDLVMFGPAKTFCYQRLQILKAKFKLHVLLNEESEMVEVRRVPHRDIYNVRKVDNHVHHSACMTQKHLLRFIKSRLEHVGDAPVLMRAGEEVPVTLKQIFDELGLTAYDLNIDALDMTAGDTFQRFDRFNMRFNPLGDSSLRTIFLKYDNFSKGQFLADITTEVFGILEEERYSFAEYRLSVYGKSPLEWNKLADWVCDFDLKSPNARWMIQVPRLYAIYKKRGVISNFGEMIDNIFRPLFEVTLNPKSNPKLHLFLNLVVGFDTVDDESIRERKTTTATPSDWDCDDNPPYLMWCYYLYANLFVLNRVREKRGLNGFAFRPHAGEAGDIDHVASTFLLCEGINHGITLKNTPVLQYLYYLKQVGISMSPLSNNLLFVAYDRNPFPSFFERGLNVTLSTDDPLLIHFTRSPLVEEYAIASQVYKLSPVDVCEIARNSVLQCGFPLSDKKHWIGPKFHLRGSAGNQIEQTNVPDIRLKFRDETLREEEALIMGLPLMQLPSGFSADYKVMRKRFASKLGTTLSEKPAMHRRSSSLGVSTTPPPGMALSRFEFPVSKSITLKTRMRPLSIRRAPSILQMAMVKETGDRGTVPMSLRSPDSAEIGAAISERKREIFKKAFEGKSVKEKILDLWNQLDADNKVEVWGKMFAQESEETCSKMVQQFS